MIKIVDDILDQSTLGNVYLLSDNVTRDLEPASYWNQPDCKLKLELPRTISKIRIREKYSFGSRFLRTFPDLILEFHVIREHEGTFIFINIKVD